jgi:HEAT repeat protein
MKRNVIDGIVCLCLIAGMIDVSNVNAQSAMEKRLDSLFVIASSGEVRFRDQNEPAMDSIAAYGAQAVPFLIDKFTTKSARERWTVIWTLQRIGSEAVPDLVAALDGEDGMVVQRVCWALGDIGDTAAVEGLIRINDHSRWQVRDQVARGLGKIGDPRGASTVERALTDEIGQVRKQAAVAFGQLGLNYSIDKVAHLLGDEFYGARWMAAEALLKLDTITVLDVLEDSLMSSNRVLGNVACWVLGKIATDEALQMLHTQAQATDPDRRSHALVALAVADPDDNCGFRQSLIENETDRFVLLKVNSAIVAAQNEQ